MSNRGQLPGERVRMGLFDHGVVRRDAGNRGNVTYLEVRWDDGRVTQVPWDSLLPETER